MRTNTQEAVLSAYIASVGKRTPREAAQDAAELCRFANSLNRLNKIACNSGPMERQERWKHFVRSGGAGSEGLRFGFASTRACSRDPYEYTRTSACSSLSCICGLCDS